MADNTVNTNLNFETNASEVTQEVNGLDSAIDKTSQSIKDNTNASDKNEEQYKTLKAQLREATNELGKMVQKYGETSKEAVKAAQSVAELKDQIGFANDLVNQFNPDQKFKALGAATQIAANGVSAVTSGMALFGETGEATQEILLKVQSAMAFSQAISGLSDLADQWELLKAAIGITTVAQEAQTVATVEGAVATRSATIAQAAFNVVANLNPYVAMATALAAVTAATVYFISTTTKAAREQAELKSSIDATNQSLKNYNDNIQYAQQITSDLTETAVLQAKLAGKSNDEIRKLEQEGRTQAYKFLVEDEARKYKLMVKASADKAKLAGDDPQYEAATKAQEAATEGWLKAQDARIKALADNSKAVLQGQLAAQAEQKAAREKANADAVASEKKRTDAIMAERAKYASKTAFDGDAIAKAEVTPTDLLKIEADKRTKIREKETQDMIKDLTTRNEVEMNKLAESRINDRLAAEAKVETYTAISQSLIDLAGTFEKTNNANQALSDASVQFDKIMADGKVESTEVIVGALQVGAAAAGKASGTGKALAVAATTISTIESAVHAFKGMVQTVPGPGGVALGTAAAAAATVSGFASVKKILAVKAPGETGGSAGGGISAPSMPSAGGAQPNVSFVSSSGNQLAQIIKKSGGNGEPIKTYVVASEVTSQQLFDQKILNKTTI